MPVFQSYAAVGEREDLADIIVNISATETPLFSAAKKKQATGILHEWQTETLRAAAQNRQVEGVDATFPTLVATTRVSAYTQIQNAHFWVSHTLEAVSKAGRDSEYQHQAEKAMKELALDTEFDVLRSASASGDGSTARGMTGVDNAITTNVATAAGAGEDLTEVKYNDLMQTIVTSGGNPNVCLVNVWQKRAISGFGGPSGASRNIAMNDKRLVNAVDIYEGNFGMQKIIYDRHMIASEIYLLELAMWRIAVLRATKHYPLPDDGGGPRGKIEHELCVEYGSEASSGKYENLTTS